MERVLPLEPAAASTQANVTPTRTPLPQQEVQASAGPPDAPGAAARLRTSLEVLEAVVSEFSLATASALGVSWEFHERCRDELEVGRCVWLCVCAVVYVCVLGESSCHQRCDGVSWEFYQRCRNELEVRTEETEYRWLCTSSMYGLRPASRSLLPV